MENQPPISPSAPAPTPPAPVSASPAPTPEPPAQKSPTIQDLQNSHQKPGKSPKPPKKPKSLDKKPKKPLIIVLISFFSLALIAGGVFCYFKFLRKSPEILKNDVEFLTEVDAWEKTGAPTVIWSFKPDGTGELTTNKENYYPLKWYLSNGKLEIDTSWLYELSDAFEISLDRTSETPSFTVKNLADETVSTFVPLGSKGEEASGETDPSEVENSAK